MDKNTFTMEKREYELIYDKHKKKGVDEKKKKIQDYFKINLDTIQKQNK